MRGVYVPKALNLKEYSFHDKELANSNVLICDSICKEVLV